MKEELKQEHEIAVESNRQHSGNISVWCMVDSAYGQDSITVCRDKAEAVLAAFGKWDILTPEGKAERESLLAVRLPIDPHPAYQSFPQGTYDFSQYEVALAYGKETYGFSEDAVYQKMSPEEKEGYDLCLDTGDRQGLEKLLADKVMELSKNEVLQQPKPIPPHKTTPPRARRR